MRKITLGLILCSMVTLCFAGQRPLEGFKYASEKAPVGWNNSPICQTSGLALWGSAAVNMTLSVAP